MYHITVNGQEMVFDKHGEVSMVDGKPLETDLIKLGPSKYHVLVNKKSMTIELLDKDESGKSMVILVNGVKHEVKVKDKYDALLSQLGMDKLMSAKQNNVKAPMPGLVLRVMVQAGDAIKKGDSLLVLEAMKMENVIKAEGDGVVKKISVEPRQAVEKNAVLIELA